MTALATVLFIIAFLTLLTAFSLSVLSHDFSPLPSSSASDASMILAFLLLFAFVCISFALLTVVNSLRRE